MVDTGAVCSVLPHRSKGPPTGPPLSGSDRKDIPCWGSIRRCLTFRVRTFFVTFLLAAVYRPILGLDFLFAHGLLVDPVCRQVLDSKSLKPLSKAKTAAGVLRSKLAAPSAPKRQRYGPCWLRSQPSSATEKENHRLSTRSATPSRRPAALCSPRPAA
jgi:hypothetical protein